MFVAHVGQCANHSTKLFADFRDKCAITRIRKIDFRRGLISSLVVS